MGEYGKDDSNSYLMIMSLILSRFMCLYCKEKFGVLVTLGLKNFQQIAIPGATNGSNKATSNIEGAMSQGFVDIWSKLAQD